MRYCFSIAAILTLFCIPSLAGLGLLFFVESLPVHLEAERWNRAHPNQLCLYSDGVVHNFVNNVLCSVGGPSCRIPDAVDLYEQLKRRQ